MARIVTLGEIMLRLKSPALERFFQSPSLEATFGGGEANVAVSLANYGMDAAFVTESNNTSHCQSLQNLYLSRHGKEKRALTHFLTLLYTMRMRKSRHQTNKERNLPI